MYHSEIQCMATSASAKWTMLREKPFGYFFMSLLAGVYVGFGIVLIFSLGGPIAGYGEGVWLKLIMGISFGIALSLVVFAGSELFTGNNMVGLAGRLEGVLSFRQLMMLFAMCYLGNLVGSGFFAWIVTEAGTLGEASRQLIQKVAITKMNLGAWELFLRGILCNWLVCLALWTGYRTKNDAARLILIFWCLFAFIASGFEHCVANMTLLSLGLLLPHAMEISVAGMVHNLLWVTLGNFIGGAVMVTLPYWWVSKPEQSPKVVKSPKEINQFDEQPVKIGTA